MLLHTPKQHSGFIFELVYPLHDFLLSDNALVRKKLIDRFR